MEYLISFILGIATSFLLPNQIKGRPVLSVLFVWLRRNKATSWLMWNVPFCGDDNWYYDRVERDVWGGGRTEHQ